MLGQTHRFTQNSGNSSLRFSGTYTGVTAQKPADVLKRLDQANEYKSHVGVFVAANPEGQGMDVVFAPMAPDWKNMQLRLDEEGKDAFILSRVSEPDEKHLKKVMSDEQAFEARVAPYNDEHGDQISWRHHTDEVPPEAEMQRRSFMSLDDALGIVNSNPTFFPTGTVHEQSIQPVERSSPGNVVSPKTERKAALNSLKRNCQRAKTLGDALAGFRATQGWD